MLDHNSIVTEVTLQLAPRFMAHSAVSAMKGDRGMERGRGRREEGGLQLALTSWLTLR